MSEFRFSEKDPLKWPAPKDRPLKSAPRIGIHTSIAGGVENAAERAYRLNCNTLQIFSTSPRQWQPYSLGRSQCEIMSQLRQKYDLRPLVIHSNYLINLAGENTTFLKKSVAAFRGELERGLALCADFLVLHPGSFRGSSRDEGLRRAAVSIAEASEGLDLSKGGLTILIENTAGAEFSLGGSFEQVAELVALLKVCAPVAVCLDTCHTHVAGYDLVSDEGYATTIKLIGATVGFDAVRVWHCNDAKAPLGSKLDRHQHIGQGTMGVEPFRRILNDKRFAHAAFIAETPVDEPGDEERNVRILKSLVK